MLPLLLMLASDPAPAPKPAPPPEIVPASPDARAEYWRARYAQLAAQMQYQQATAAIDAATKKLCEPSREAGIGQDGDVQCKQRPPAK